MEQYFRKEMAEGKTEFRLVAELVNGVVKVMIHPMGKDEQTIDLYVRGNGVENMNGCSE
jgi:hypothetical protein